jgi:hypothetical protein
MSADEARDRRRQSGGGLGGRVERDVLPQDLRLELRQLGSRLDAELAVERTAGPVVSRQCDRPVDRRDTARA